MKSILLFLLLFALSFSSFALSLEYEHYAYTKLPTGEFVFVPDYKIGDFTFSPSLTKLDFSKCNFVSSEIDSRDVEQDCFYVDVSFAGNKYKINGGETVKLTNQIEVRYEPLEAFFEWTSDQVSGTTGYLLREGKYKNRFHFNFIDPGKVQWVTQDTVAEIGSDAAAKINVVQFLANNIEGGFDYKTTPKIYPKEEFGRQKTTFRSGSSVYEIKVPSHTLGPIDVDTQMFYFLYGNKIVESSEPTSDACTSYQIRGNLKYLCLQKEMYDIGGPVKATYVITPKTWDPQTSTSCASNSDCPPEFICEAVKHQNSEYSLCFKGETQKSTNLLLIFLVLVSLLVIGGLIYYFYKNSKKKTGKI